MQEAFKTNSVVFKLDSVVIPLKSANSKRSSLQTVIGTLFLRYHKILISFRYYIHFITCVCCYYIIQIEIFSDSMDLNMTCFFLLKIHLQLDWNFKLAIIQALEILVVCGI